METYRKIVMNICSVNIGNPDVRLCGMKERIRMIMAIDTGMGMTVQFKSSVMIILPVASQQYFAFGFVA